MTQLVRWVCCISSPGVDDLLAQWNSARCSVLFFFPKLGSRPVFYSWFALCPHSFCHSAFLLLLLWWWMQPNGMLTFLRYDPGIWRGGIYSVRFVCQMMGSSCVKLQDRLFMSLWSFTYNLSKLFIIAIGDVSVPDILQSFIADSFCRGNILHDTQHVFLLLHCLCHKPPGNWKLETSFFFALKNKAKPLGYLFYIQCSSYFTCKTLF